MSDEPGVAMTPEEFARERHAGQPRKGTDLPYIVHPEGVAQILERRYPGDTDLIAAGWLHDTLEDTTATPEELEVRFGPEVRRLVEAVTRQAGEPFHPPAGADAMRLKAADALDNVTATLEGLRRGEPVFERFKQGRAKVRYWRGIADAAVRVLGDEPLVGDLTAAVEDAEGFAHMAGSAIRATYICGSCGKVASIVTLVEPGHPDPGLAAAPPSFPPGVATVFRDLHPDDAQLSVVGGPLSVTHGLVPRDRAAAAIATGSPAALYEIDSEYVPFWCPRCSASYCRDHYIPEVFNDMGFYDYTLATCPQGHTRKIDD